MRLIDADALIHELNNSHFPGAPYVDAGISIAIGKVCYAPTIEPQRKKGKWIWSEDNASWCCSTCDCVFEEIDWKPEYNYCPNCGAKMFCSDWTTTEEMSGWIKE